MGSVLLWGLGGLVMGFFIVWAVIKLSGRANGRGREPMLKLEVRADIVHRHVQSKPGAEDFDRWMLGAPSETRSHGRGHDGDPDS